ncbi:MAG: hypothetical protein AB1798_21570, partial [Spirochaetota bacterium]
MNPGFQNILTLRPSGMVILRAGRRDNNVIQSRGRSSISTVEEANPISKTGEDEPNELLVEKALMAEIREKCHYFMTFLLTEEQRVALLLKDLFDFSYQEMAYLLELNEDVIR